MMWRQSRLVAGVVARNLGRRRATWSTTLLTGIVVAVLVVGSAFVTTRVRQRIEVRPYGVAVAGDVAGAEAFLTAIDGPLLVFSTVDDANTEVAASEAAAGLVLPDDLDGRIARGEDPEVSVFYRSRSEQSVAARNELLLALQGQQRQVVLGDLAGAGVDPPEPTTFTFAEVTTDAAGNRLSLAPMLAALAALLCLGVVTSAAAAAGGGRDDRSIEGTLVLPLRRGALTAGTVAGVVPVAGLGLLAAVALLCVASALPLAGLHQSGADVARLLAVCLPGALLLAVLAAAVGTLAGVLGAGSEDAVSIGDLLSVPFVAVAALYFLAPDAVSGPVAWVLPILGPVTAMRDGVLGTLTVVEALVVVVSGVGWIAAVVALATARFADERRVLRTG